jgi:hypothetical protein
MSKGTMIYIFSTMAASVEYPITRTRDDKSYDIVESVQVNGGHGVANKHFVTPRGVMTSLTKENYDKIKDNHTFQTHLQNGFLEVSETAEDPEKVIASMAHKGDASAPKTPEDYVEGDEGAKPAAETKAKK